MMKIDKATIAARRAADRIRDVRVELEEYGQTGVLLSGEGVDRLSRQLRAMERESRGPKLPPPRVPSEMARRYGRAS